MKKAKIGILFVILLVFLLGKGCYAKGKIEIIPEKEKGQKGEEISIKIQITEMPIGACTLELYWDMEQLEYLRGPENANYSNHRILYTWVSETGEDKENFETEALVFKVLQEKSSNMRVLGECYNAKGEAVEIESGSFIIETQEKEPEKEMIDQEEISGQENNTNLKVLRLNHEGISPDFEREVKDYYFIADSSIHNLEVTAIPENPYASVNITGNTNLKMGENKIEIRVVSQDKSKEAVYQIHVTRTQNKEQANANLENLAVRQGILIPEFDPRDTKYTVEIPTQSDKIDLLAIPQKEKAKVTILGNERMEIGDNIVQIKVIAEDGISNKTYEIVVRRRNEQEEEQYKQEKQIQAEKLSLAIEQEQKEETREMVKENKRINGIWIIIGTVIVVSISGIVIIRKKKKTID